ncbi:MAG UNVERIFIED_CONTAM: hypothetical protein LVQ98_02630 [Rickettsiaceae bacterium]|jgi:hypothetical protein
MTQSFDSYVLKLSGDADNYIKERNSFTIGSQTLFVPTKDLGMQFLATLSDCRNLLPLTPYNISDQSRHQNFIQKANEAFLKIAQTAPSLFEEFANKPSPLWFVNYRNLLYAGMKFLAMCNIVAPNDTSKDVLTEVFHNTKPSNHDLPPISSAIDTENGVEYKNLAAFMKKFAPSMFAEFKKAYSDLEALAIQGTKALGKKPDTAEVATQTDPAGDIEALERKLREK